MTLALLVLLLLMAQQRKPHPTGLDIPSTTSAADAAAAAQAAAAAAAAKAAQTGDPVHQAQATQAAQTAQVLTDHAKTQIQTAKATPVPWPQAMPSGLPPFPAGWTPDNPPPPAVVSRSWQLLAPLWKRGSGARQTEQTNGRWITYVATPMGGGKRGVTAWRTKDGLAPSKFNPSGNA